MLNIQNLSKRYDNITALQAVSFSVDKNSVVGILGENGAGKTTLINLMSSIIRPDSGTIMFDNKEYGSREYKEKIGVALGGEVSLYERLTVKENLEYYSSLYGRKDNSLINILKEKLDFEDYFNKRIETLSRGMQQRISIATALLNNPDLIMFDEPTIGLDYSGQMIIKQLVKDLRNQGKTVLYSTNIIQEVREVCDKVLIINKGKLVEYDTVDAIELKHEKNIEGVFAEIIGGRCGL